MVNVWPQQYFNQSVLPCFVYMIKKFGVGGCWYYIVDFFVCNYAWVPACSLFSVLVKEETSKLKYKLLKSGISIFFGKQREKELIALCFFVFAVLLSHHYCNQSVLTFAYPYLRHWGWDVVDITLRVFSVVIMIKCLIVL